MTTRLIVWNIQFFTINRVQGRPGETSEETLANVVQAIANHVHIRSIGATADIFVMIEVLSTRSDVGTLIGGGGAQGVLFLLNYLRTIDNSNWCLVPPLKLVGRDELGNKTYTEGIAVFFRSDKLDFTGPYIWPQSGKAAVPANSKDKDGKNVVPGDYPAPWDTSLPAGNHFAGQCRFFIEPENQRGEILFANANQRRPFLTTFTEISSGRAIKLLSVHPSPTVKTQQAVSRMVNIKELKPASTPTVVVITGDFNINVYSTSVLELDTYKTFIRNDYKQLFNTDTPGTRGRTRVLNVKDATPNEYLRPEGLDNAFVRYDGGAVAPLSHDPLIIDSVVDVQNYRHDMFFSLEEFYTLFPNEEERNDQFRNAVNYGHIGAIHGTSDHLPLVIDL
jgi:hypothetical protein